MTIHCGCDVGVDFVKKHLIQLKRDKHSVECVQACAEHLPFRNKCFESTVFTETIEHVVYPKLALSEVCRVGKQLILTTPLTYIPDHIRLYSLNDILSLVNEFITIEYFTKLEEAGIVTVFIKGRCKCHQKY